MCFKVGVALGKWAWPQKFSGAPYLLALYASESELISEGTCSLMFGMVSMEKQARVTVLANYSSAFLVSL